MLRLMPHPLQFAFQSAGPLPARSLSCRLCRDASSPLPPSSDVGKFIRGTAFPIARAGLRRPQMRSAAECSRPSALFRPPDGFSARPGMSPPRAAGCIPAPATNRPRGACPIGFAGTHRLLSRLLRMSENSSGAPPFRSPVRDCGVRRCGPRPSFARPTDFRHAPACRRPVRRGAFRLRRRTARAELVRSALPGRIVFSPAFSGCRKIHPGRRLSDRPCGIAASADAFRRGMLPPRGPLSRA